MAAKTICAEHYPPPGTLTLADLNEEGANLLALQTRQQMGVQVLSFAGQAERGILALFR
ncbi:MAG: hypothetical protein V3U48_09395 [Rhodospirillales bacterium]